LRIKPFGDTIVKVLLFFFARVLVFC